MVFRSVDPPGTRPDSRATALSNRAIRVIGVTFPALAILALVLGLSDSDASYAKPLATTTVSAIAASLARIIFGTRLPRTVLASHETTPEAENPTLSYRWTVEILGSAACAGSLFFLATLAFNVREASDYNNAGLTVFGAIAGLLGSSLAGWMSTTEPSHATPFAEITRLISSQIDVMTPSVRSEVESTLRDSLIGPETPSYSGWVHTRLVPAIDSQLTAELEVWFDTEKQGSNEPSERAHLLRLGTDGSSASEESMQAPADGYFAADLLLHVPTDSRSPFGGTLEVPLHGRSDTIRFGNVSTTDGPNRSVVEIRVNGRIVQVVEVGR